MRPLAPETYRVQFTITRDTYDKLRQAQDLLRHSIPKGDLAVIFDRALTLLLADAPKTKYAATRHHPGSRETASTHERIFSQECGALSQRFSHTGLLPR